MGIHDGRLHNATVMSEKTTWNYITEVCSRCGMLLRWGCAENKPGKLVPLRDVDEELAEHIG